jgi:hypothetical protein
MRYELDRCNFTYATSDLKQFLETHLSCESKATTQKDDRSIFMTAGGAWVGRWYTGNPRICKKPGGTVEGLLEYTTERIVGYENECDVERIAPAGAGVEIVSVCHGEGFESREKEYLEVKNGNLQRSVQIGPRRRTFSYKLCPS